MHKHNSDNNKSNMDIIHFNKLNLEIKYLINNISDIALVTGNNSVLMEIYKTVDEFNKIKWLFTYNSII